MKNSALILALLAPSVLSVAAADKNPSLLPEGIKGRILLRMPASKAPDNPEGKPGTTPGEGIRVITVGGRSDRWGKVNGPPGTSQFFDPHAIAVDPEGNAYIAEHWNHGIRKITAGQYIASEVANHLHHPTGLCRDDAGNLYVTRFYCGDVLRITPGGAKTVVQRGFNRPCAVCVDGNGNMWVANTYSGQIIRITPTGRRTIWNGMRAHHMALGPNDDLYVACQTDQTIRRIGAHDHPGTPVEIVAGKPHRTGPIDGPVSEARFTDISGIAVSPSGTIFVGDHNTIRRISVEGQVITIAGNPNEPGIVDGPAHQARLRQIAGLAFDSKGNLWVANRDKVVRLVINAESSVQIKDGVYSGWRFIGFSPEVKADLVEVLLRLKKDAPVHYKMATYRVKTFSWAPKRGSFAIPGNNFVAMGERDWKHSKSWFAITVIHEIQHNNEPGDESEAAACWAGWYYGEKLRCSPFQLQYTKALALKQGYNPTKWDRNIKATLAENSKH